MTTATPPPDDDPIKDASLDQLFNAVYDRLKAMASRQLSRGAPGTLDTTALVHELYLRFDRERDLGRCISADERA